MRINLSHGSLDEGMTPYKEENGYTTLRLNWKAGRDICLGSDVRIKVRATRQVGPYDDDGDDQQTPYNDKEFSFDAGCSEDSPCLPI